MKKKPEEPLLPPAAIHERDLLTSVTTLDPEGLMADIQFLTQQEWRTESQADCRVEWVKGESLSLVASAAQENNHRIAWELTVQLKAVRIGYATKTLRPGDLKPGILHTLISEAVAAGEKEVNSWKDALADARRHLGV